MADHEIWFGSTVHPYRVELALAFVKVVHIAEYWACGDTLAKGVDHCVYIAIKWRCRQRFTQGGIVGAFI